MPGGPRPNSWYWDVEILKIGSFFNYFVTPYFDATYLDGAVVLFDVTTYVEVATK